MKVTLNENMLKFNVDLATSTGDTSYAKAVDGGTGQGWTDCANSVRAPDIQFLLLSINLGRLYSVSNVKMLSRMFYGTKTEIYVGKSAIQADGSVDLAKDHKCGDKYPVGNASTGTLTDFSCSSVGWVQYVTIRRRVGTDFANQHLLVCEVEVYYNKNEGTANI